MNLILVVKEDSEKLHRTLGNEKTFMLWNLAASLIVKLLGIISIHFEFRMVYQPYFTTCECIITDFCRCAC